MYPQIMLIKTDSSALCLGIYCPYSLLFEVQVSYLPIVTLQTIKSTFSILLRTFKLTYPRGWLLLGRRT